MELLKTTKLLHSWRSKQPMSGKLIELENFRTIIQNILKIQNIKSHKNKWLIKKWTETWTKSSKTWGEMAKKYLRNILYSSPLAIGEKAKQTAWRYLSYPKMRMGRKKSNHQQLLEWVWGIGNPYSQLVGLQIGPDTWNLRWRILQKLKQNLLYYTSLYHAQSTWHPIPKIFAQPY